MGGEGHKYLNGLQLYLLDEAKKFRGVTGVDQSLLDVANWEVVPGGQMPLFRKRITLDILKKKVH